MKWYLELNVYQLRVLSVVSSNFVVVWLGATAVSRNLLVIFLDIVLALVFWYIATKTEEAIGK